MKACIVCGRDDEWVVASVDLNELLCINCLDDFDNWCDTHPGEPFQNFIHPKPWEPKNPGFIILTLEGGETWAYCPPTGHAIREMYGYMAKDVEETRELFPIEKLVGPMLRECF